ncbi:hypothetical protein HFP51_11635 [Parasphingopyxis sp. CP4]|uniref:hypothetical protein n=1 Tax=Parasphingopyxis sp. CP4 TaxID=2724527 RepID=UPI0015A11C19|nr:hypothetical protein [Parasphingopyxis sp. CP4]QLC22774.1 hypothetical protein HFP51_11635 [Parasphingopyxis sp. CP4]
MVRIMIAVSALALASCTGGTTGNESDAIDEASIEPDASTDAAATESLDAMPDEYLGRWDFTEETCADPASDMRLDIAANEIRYYESAAVPTTITADEDGIVMVEHSFSGEGEEWTEMLAYELSEDGERLTVSQADGSLSIRMRCPT